MDMTIQRVQDETEQGVCPPMSVAVAYEDSTSRQHAIHLSDHMVHQYWEDLDIEFSWWKLAYLKDQEVLKAATQATAEADVVVLSLRAGFELTPMINGWIERWVKARAPKPGALVGLLEAHTARPEATRGLKNWLKEIAQLAGMELFCQEFPSPAEFEGLSLDTLSQRAGVITPLLEEILTHIDPVQRWGINE
jgi:hypothetical protein